MVHFGWTSLMWDLTNTYFEFERNSENKIVCQRTTFPSINKQTNNEAVITMIITLQELPPLQYWHLLAQSDHGNNQWHYLRHLGCPLLCWAEESYKDHWKKKTYIFILVGTFYVPYMKFNTNQCGSWTAKSVIEKQRKTLYAIILTLNGLFQAHNLEQFSKDCPKK